MCICFIHKILELLVQRDKEFQELMEVAQQQGKVHQEMQLLEKEVEKRDSDIQQLQKQLKEAEHILVGLACLLFLIFFFFSSRAGQRWQIEINAQMF